MFRYDDSRAYFSNCLAQRLTQELHSTQHVASLTVQRCYAVRSGVGFVLSEFFRLERNQQSEYIMLNSCAVCLCVVSVFDIHHARLARNIGKYTLHVQF